MNRAQPPFAPLLAVLGLLLVAWLSLTQTASAVCLPQDHSDLFATSANLSTHQETDALPPKNRVWENFENSNEITPEDQLNSLQLRWKTHFSQPELASGIPVFLNADPSGFSGGSNWFAYADGNPISLSDPFGLCAERNACTGGYGMGSATAEPYTLPSWANSTLDILMEMASGVGGSAVGGGPGPMYHGDRNLIYEMDQPGNQAGMLATSLSGILIGPGPGGLTSTGNNSTTLYRAVGQNELKSVISGTYGSSPSMAGKYFALTQEGVENFANSAFNAGQRMTVTSTTVPSSTLNQAYRFIDVGAQGAGPSIHIQEEFLKAFYNTMSPIKVH